MLRLFPRPWRRRYGDEYLALLEELGPSTLVVLDTVRAALDAHLHPSLGAEPAPSVDPDPVAAAVPVVEAPTLPPPRPFASLRPDGFEIAIDEILGRAAEQGAFDDCPARASRSTCA